MNTHKFKQVYIPTGEVWEKEFTEKSHPAQYDRYMTHVQFLELINRWNAGSVLQSKVTESGKVDWLYIAL